MDEYEIIILKKEETQPVAVFKLKELQVRTDVLQDGRQFVRIAFIKGEQYEIEPQQAKLAAMSPAVAQYIMEQMK